MMIKKEEGMWKNEAEAHGCSVLVMDWMMHTLAICGGWCFKWKSGFIDKTWRTIVSVYCDKVAKMKAVSCL